MISDQDSWGSPETANQESFGNLSPQKSLGEHPGRSGQVPPSCKDPNLDSG